MFKDVIRLSLSWGKGEDYSPGLPFPQAGPKPGSERGKGFFLRQRHSPRNTSFATANIVHHPRASAEKILWTSPMTDLCGKSLQPWASNGAGGHKSRFKLK